MLNFANANTMMQYLGLSKLKGNIYMVSCYKKYVFSVNLDLSKPKDKKCTVLVVKMIFFMQI